MKKIISLSLIVGLCVSAFSQVDIKEAKEYFDVPGGVQNVDKKVLRNPAPQSLPYIALKFRTGSVEALVGGNKGVKTYAMLDGIDSLIFQEITNEFSKIFIQKLTEVGVAFVDMAKIKDSKLYKERLAEPEKDPRNFNYKNTGTADVFTNDHELLWYYPTGGLKGAKFMGETGGGAAFLRLTVDFVEFDTDISKTYGWNVTTTNYSAKAFPTVKITSDHYAEGGTMTMATSPQMGGGFSMSNPKNYMGVLFSQLKPIYEKYEGKTEVYDDKIPKFANKNSRVFGGGMTLGTFVIEANREAYKKAALTALTRYADYVAAMIKSYNTEEKKK
ncbi:MAG: hypothetical protein IT440_15475 [Phycisphaeraceae bacterium]|nr:hypothetical protein [Phycisphaeraceae bacterium]